MHKSSPRLHKIAFWGLFFLGADASISGAELVGEMGEGGCLVERGLSLEHLRCLALQIISAISYCHERRVIHRLDPRLKSLILKTQTLDPNLPCCRGRRAIHGCDLNPHSREP